MMNDERDSSDASFLEGPEVLNESDIWGCSDPFDGEGGWGKMALAVQVASSKGQVCYDDWSAGNGSSDDSDEWNVQDEQGLPYSFHSAELQEKLERIGVGQDRQMEFYVNEEACYENSCFEDDDVDKEGGESVETELISPNFINVHFLETIYEETDDEVQTFDIDSSSPSSSSNSASCGFVWSWADTEETGSVIYVPTVNVNGFDVEHDRMDDNEGQPDSLSTNEEIAEILSESESELHRIVPIKKRLLLRDESSRSSSVTDSLLQFEIFEQEASLTENEPLTDFLGFPTSPHYKKSWNSQENGSETSCDASPAKKRAESDNTEECVPSAQNYGEVTSSSPDENVPTIRNSIRSISQEKIPSREIEVSAQCTVTSEFTEVVSESPESIESHYEKLSEAHSGDCDQVVRQDSVYENYSFPGAEQIVPASSASNQSVHFDHSTDLNKYEHSDDAFENGERFEHHFSQYEVGIHSSEDEYSPSSSDSENEYGGTNFVARSPKCRLRSFTSFDNLNLLGMEEEEERDFDEEEQFGKRVSFPRSLSIVNEGTESDSSNEDKRGPEPILEEQTSPTDSLQSSLGSQERLNYNRNHSVENLSEDSGYGDSVCRSSPPLKPLLQLLKSSSDSIPEESAFQDATEAAVLSDRRINEEWNEEFGAKSLPLDVLPRGSLAPEVLEFGGNVSEENTALPDQEPCNAVRSTHTVDYSGALPTLSDATVFSPACLLLGSVALSPQLTSTVAINLEPPCTPALNSPSATGLSNDVSLSAELLLQSTSITTSSRSDSAYSSHPLPAEANSPTLSISHAPTCAVTSSRSPPNELPIYAISATVSPPNECLVDIINATRSPSILIPVDENSAATKSVGPDSMLQYTRPIGTRRIDYPSQSDSFRKENEFRIACTLNPTITRETIYVVNATMCAPQICEPVENIGLSSRTETARQSEKFDPSFETESTFDKDKEDFGGAAGLSSTTVEQFIRRPLSPNCTNGSVLTVKDKSVNDLHQRTAELVGDSDLNGKDKTKALDTAKACFEIVTGCSEKVDVTTDDTAEKRGPTPVRRNIDRHCENFTTSCEAGTVLDGATACVLQYSAQACDTGAQNCVEVADFISTESFLRAEISCLAETPEVPPIAGNKVSSWFDSSDEERGTADAHFSTSPVELTVQKSTRSYICTDKTLPRGTAQFANTGTRYSKSVVSTRASASDLHYSRSTEKIDSITNGSDFSHRYESYKSLERGSNTGSIRSAKSLADLSLLDTRSGNNIVFPPSSSVGFSPSSRQGKSVSIGNLARMNISEMMKGVIELVQTTSEETAKVVAQSTDAVQQPEAIRKSFEATKITLTKTLERLEYLKRSMNAESKPVRRQQRRKSLHEPLRISALLERRNPKTRPAPLSLSDAEVFLTEEGLLSLEAQLEAEPARTIKSLSQSQPNLSSETLRRADESLPDNRPSEKPDVERLAAQTIGSIEMSREAESSKKRQISQLEPLSSPALQERHSGNSSGGGNESTTTERNFESDIRPNAYQESSDCAVEDLPSTDLDDCSSDELEVTLVPSTDSQDDAPPPYLRHNTVDHPLEPSPSPGDPTFVNRSLQSHNHTFSVIGNKGELPEAYESDLGTLLHQNVNKCDLQIEVSQNGDSEVVGRVQWTDVSESVVKRENNVPSPSQILSGIYPEATSGSDAISVTENNYYSNENMTCTTEDRITLRRNNSSRISDFDRVPRRSASSNSSNYYTPLGQSPVISRPFHRVDSYSSNSSSYITVKSPSLDDITRIYGVQSGDVVQMDELIHMEPEPYRKNVEAIKEWLAASGDVMRGAEGCGSKVSSQPDASEARQDSLSVINRKSYTHDPSLDFVDIFEQKCLAADILNSQCLNVTSEDTLVPERSSKLKCDFETVTPSNAELTEVKCLESGEEVDTSSSGLLNRVEQITSSEKNNRATRSESVRKAPTIVRTHSRATKGQKPVTYVTKSYEILTIDLTNGKQVETSHLSVNEPLGEKDLQLRQPIASPDPSSSSTLFTYESADGEMIAMLPNSVEERVPLRRYGDSSDVQVYLAKERSSTPLRRPNSPTHSQKGVHFSPVVSTVNWRESFIEDSTPVEKVVEPERFLVVVDDSTLPAPEKVLFRTISPGHDATVTAIIGSTFAEKSVEPDESDTSFQRSRSLPSRGSTASLTIFNSQRFAVNPGKKAKSSENIHRIKEPPKEQKGLFERLSLSRLSSRVSARFDSKKDLRKVGHANPHQDEPKISSSPSLQKLEKKPKAKTPEKKKETEQKSEKKSKTPEIKPKLDKAEKRANTPEKEQRSKTLKEKSSSENELHKKSKKKNPEKKSAFSFFNFGRRKKYEVTTPTKTDVESTPTTPTVLISPSLETPVDRLNSAVNVLSDICIGIEDPVTKQSPPLPGSPTPPSSLSFSIPLNSLDTSPPSRRAPSSLDTTPPSRCATAFQPSSDSSPVESMTNAAKPPLPPASRPRNRRLFVTTPPDSPKSPIEDLQFGLERFKQKTLEERIKIAQSSPDLVAMPVRETAIDRIVLPYSDLGREKLRKEASSRTASIESLWSANAEKCRLNNSRRPSAESSVASTPTPRQRTDLRAKSVSPGVLETNLDNVQFRQTDLGELIGNLENFAQVYYDSRAKSMLHLDRNRDTLSYGHLKPKQTDSRAKSVEYLLDDEHKTALQPPENELQRTGERQPSEYELRVQRSLQKLNVPDWYKPKETSQTSSFRRDSTSSDRQSLRWSDIRRNNSRATSMVTLDRSVTPVSRVSIQTRVRAPDSWRSVKTSRDNLISPSSTLSSAAPSPSVYSVSPRDGSHFNYSNFSRAGSARYSTGTPSLSGSRTSLITAKPYLGWRSQERINITDNLYKTPSERLAGTIQTRNAETLPTQDVETSLREVTSAIQEFVNDKPISPAISPRLPRDQKSASPSGRKQRIWVESSFVGSRGNETPSTPMTHERLNEQTEGLSNDFLNKRTVPTINLLKSPAKPEEIAAEPEEKQVNLEDMLDSLLGLPTNNFKLRRPNSQPAIRRVFTNQANNRPNTRSFTDLRKP